jgi:hypothetical protein
VQEHEDAICRKLLDSARDPEVVQGLQRRLALIVFDHVALKNPGENISELKKTAPYAFQRNPAMDFIHLNCKFILDTLHL